MYCIQCALTAISDDSVGLPSTTSPSQPADLMLHQTCDSETVPLTTAAVPIASSSNDIIVTEAIDSQTAKVTDVTVGTDEVLSTSNSIPTSSQPDTSTPGT